MQDSITPVKAMQLLREYARQNIPCSIKFLSYNETEKRCSGIKEENNILLTVGYRRNQSKKNEVLASFTRLSTGENRQFYWPLLMELNGRKIKP